MHESRRDSRVINLDLQCQKINHKTCIKLIDLDELTGEVDSDGTGTIDLETFVEVVRVKQKQAEDEVEIKVVYTKKC